MILDSLWILIPIVAIFCYWIMGGLDKFLLIMLWAISTYVLVLGRRENTRQQLIKETVRIDQMQQSYVANCHFVMLDLLDSLLIIRNVAVRDLENVEQESVIREQIWQLQQDTSCTFSLLIRNGNPFNSLSADNAQIEQAIGRLNEFRFRDGSPAVRPQ